MLLPQGPIKVRNKSVPSRCSRSKQGQQFFEGLSGLVVSAQTGPPAFIIVKYHDTIRASKRDWPLPSIHGTRNIILYAYQLYTVCKRLDSQYRKRRQYMYATVRRYEGVTNPGEAARRVNEGFVPLISQIPGFVAYYWVDAGSGVMISTSVFQDQASAEESNRRAADYVRQNLVSVLPNPPQVTAGEVVTYKAQ